MSDWSDDALTAARKAWHELPPTVPMTVIIMRMVDAVEPIIRADERERIAQAIEAAMESPARSTSTPTRSQSVTRPPLGCPPHPGPPTGCGPEAGT